MQVALPRAIGVAGLVMSYRLLPGAVVEYPSLWSWIAFSSLWLATSIMLVRVRGVRFAGLVLAAMGGLWLFWPEVNLASGLPLLAWFGLVLAVSEGRPSERALLVRVLVTSVYAFTALSKLNPAFLAGDQLVEIATTRAHMEVFLPLFTSRIAVALAVATVLVEAWLAVGLWIARTRKATVALGVCTHVVLWASATLSIGAGLHLAVLNGLLVSGYLAFFTPVEMPRLTAVLRRPQRGHVGGGLAPRAAPGPSVPSGSGTVAP